MAEDKKEKQLKVYSEETPLMVSVFDYYIKQVEERIKLEEKNEIPS